MKYSIAITTFDLRFEQYFLPLLQDIRHALNRSCAEVIVMVNGPHKKEFDQNYRRQILNTLADCDRVYPTFFPNFQSLAKLWNRAALTASCEHVLVLNDDLRIEADFFDAFDAHLENPGNLKNQQGIFKINESFSHFLLTKRELIEIGFFDERLLGIGEEDGDFSWRYHEKYKKTIPNVNIKGIQNIQSELADSGFSKGIGKYSRFNREFVLQKKYKKSLFGHKGMFDHKMAPLLDNKTQYPYESFYLENIEKL